MELLSTRNIFFLFTVFCLILLEIIFPIRKTNHLLTKRKLSNVLLILPVPILLKIFPIISTAQIAKLVEQANWGIFKLITNQSISYLFIFQIIILDLAIYFQHRLFHLNSFFWKFHKVHHSDQILDWTTALRFHPIEIFISLLFKNSLVFLFGISVQSYLIFEIILSTMTLFNHSNLKLPQKLNCLLQHFIVTPYFHQWHHSVEKDNMHSNFGFNLTIWDTLFKTKLKNSNFSTQSIRLGLKNETNDNQFFKLLLRPWD